MTKVSELREIAMDKGGFIVARDAADVGMDPRELPQMAYKGRLVHELHGIYRFPDFPTDDTTELRLALIWAGPEAALDGETVLAFLELCDVNPRAVHVVVPPGVRVRKQGKPIFQLRKGRVIIDYYQGLPITTVSQAIKRAAESGMRLDLAQQAVDTAARRELLATSAARQLMADLKEKGRR